MWEWMKYLELAIRLGTLFQNLKSVKAKTATSADYGAAAAVILSDARVKRWLANRTPEEQAAFTDNLHVFIFALDAMTE